LIVVLGLPQASAISRDFICVRRAVLVSRDAAVSLRACKIANTEPGVKVAHSQIKRGEEAAICDLVRLAFHNLVKGLFGFLINPKGIVRSFIRVNNFPPALIAKRSYRFTFNIPGDRKLRSRRAPGRRPSRRSPNSRRCTMPSHRKVIASTTSTSVRIWSQPFGSNLG